MNTSSLDDILREIEDTPTAGGPVQSAGMGQVADHLTLEEGGRTSPMQWANQDRSSVTSTLVGGGMTLSKQMDTSDALSVQQRRLPRINLSLFGSVVAVMVMMVGVGTATYLSQQKQDLRQQAYQGNRYAVSSPGVTPVPMKTTTIVRSTETPAAASTAVSISTLGSNPLLLVGAAMIAIGVFALTGVIYWLFRG
jgi:hypothetical protein